MALTFAVNVAVLANPAQPLSAPEKSRVPLSKRVFDLQKEWREKKQPDEKKWRASQEESMTLEKDRFKSPPPALYDPARERDLWDPYAASSQEKIHGKPPTLFEFRF